MTDTWNRVEPLDYAGAETAYFDGATVGDRVVR